MKLLLDTHVFLWLVGAPEKLTERALEACKDRRNPDVGRLKPNSPAPGSFEGVDGRDGTRDPLKGGSDPVASPRRAAAWSARALARLRGRGNGGSDPSPGAFKRQKASTKNSKKSLTSEVMPERKSKKSLTSTFEASKNSKKSLTS